jgi:sugar transferase (PEP-CTERM system associated)
VIHLFGQYFSPRKTVFILGEGILIYSAVTLASFFLLGRDMGIVQVVEAEWTKILLVAAVTQLCLYFNDLYEMHAGIRAIELATRLTLAIGITSIVLAVIYFLWAEAMIGRWIFFMSVVFLVLFLVSWRILYTYVIHRRLFVEKAVILGSGELSKHIFEELKNNPDIGYDIRYVVDERDEKAAPSQFSGIPVQYGFGNLYDLAAREQVSSIIVALDQKRGVMPYKDLLSCKVRGISIVDGESFYERITGKLLVEKINPSSLIFSDGFKKSPVTRFMKRAFGLLLSAIMLICLSPLLIVVAIAIKLDSPGPALFSQERVGEDSKIFKIYKFRSMKTDAERESGPVWAADGDPRITRVGRIIRKLRIDELPQLWNVLRGDMSFVGPRPERPYFVEKLKGIIPYYEERFTVKPGVTGWAQILYPYGASDEDALEKLKYDLYYIKNMSMVMDLMVIFYTMKIVLLGRGSR